MPAVEIWDTENTTLTGTIREAGGNVFALAVLPGTDKIAVAEGATHSITVTTVEDGGQAMRLGGIGRPVRAVGLSADGETLAWGQSDPCPAETYCPQVNGPLEYQVALPTSLLSFTAPRPLGPGDGPFRQAVTDVSSGNVELQLTGSQATDSFFEFSALTLSRDGEEMRRIIRDFRDGYRHSAYSFLPGARSFVSGGGDGSILSYDAETGSFAGEFGALARAAGSDTAGEDTAGEDTGHSDDVLAFAAARDRPLLVSGSADQTIRFWNSDTGAAVAGFFATDDDWIFWTPEGYYHSSPDADRLIGWHINQGPDKAARFITARQLKRHLNSPEIVRLALSGLDAGAAAVTLRGEDAELAQLLTRRAPELSVSLLNEGAPVDGIVRLKVDAGGSLDDGTLAERITIRINDRQISALTGRAAGNPPVIDLALEPGENVITVIAENAFGYATERGSFVLNPLTTEKEAPGGDLYVAVVGVQDYPLLPNGCAGQSCDLRYPVADAVAFLRTVDAVTRPMFDDVKFRVFLDAEPLAGQPSDRDALSRLLGGARPMTPDARTVTFELLDFLEEPGPEDTTLIFVAGHGISLGEDYYLIPNDGRQRADGSWARASLVDWRLIQDAINRTDGRKVLFVDTCHAGNAYNAKLEKEAADNRISVISATAANNIALELPELGHGIFTFALIRGLSGAAPGGSEGVGILDLASYISNEVVRISESRQEPVFHFPQPVTNFLVARP